MALVALSAPLLALIPHAAIAGLLLLVAWTLLDTPAGDACWPRSAAGGDRGGDLAATVTIRMEVAILLGTVLSLMAYLHRVAARHAHHGLRRARAGPPLRRDGAAAAAEALPECPQLLRMEGSVPARPRTWQRLQNCAPRRTRRVICWSWPRA